MNRPAPSTSRERNMKVGLIVRSLLFYVALPALQARPLPVDILCFDPGTVDARVTGRGLLIVSKIIEQECLPDQRVMETLMDGKWVDLLYKLITAGGPENGSCKYIISDPPYCTPIRVILGASNSTCCVRNDSGSITLGCPVSQPSIVPPPEEGFNLWVVLGPVLGVLGVVLAVVLLLLLLWIMLKKCGPGRRERGRGDGQGQGGEEQQQDGVSLARRLLLVLVGDFTQGNRQNTGGDTTDNGDITDNVIGVEAVSDTENGTPLFTNFSTNMGRSLRKRQEHRDTQWELAVIPDELLTANSTKSCVVVGVDDSHGLESPTTVNQETSRPLDVVYIVCNKDEYVRPTPPTLNDEQQDSEMSVVVVPDEFLTVKPCVVVSDSPVPESSPTITTTTVHQETFCPSSDKIFVNQKGEYVYIRPQQFFSSKLSQSHSLQHVIEV